MRVALFFIFIGLIAISCQKQKVQGKRYFDLDSLVNAQILYLSKTKASLKKEVIFTEKSSASTNILDSAAWSYELDVFRQLDLINRPIYFDVYQVKDGIKDSKSNLLVRSYEADGKSPVPYLRLFYQGTPSRIKKLEALYSETNSLYSSQRKLEMYFDDAPGNPYLTGFFIEGEQKMIMSDSVHYTIRTEIQ
ncbi:MAG: hypothetical protein JJE09_12675 [Bacteroidia bacterium]|nr:hypothetical protein [Bacteroidia bacterium]